MSRGMFDFDVLEKDMETISTPYFVYDFSRKMFLMSYFIKWTSFIGRLLLLLDMLSNMFIARSCFPGGDIINFKINLIFLIKPKSQDKKLNILRTKRTFKVN